MKAEGKELYIRVIGDVSEEQAIPKSRKKEGFRKDCVCE